MMSNVENNAAISSVGEEFLTIEEISKATELEESLLRFYESEYEDQLPAKVWRGDSLCFTREALACFERIHASHGTEQSIVVPEEETKKERFARVIAVTSGKGGVGKTNIALNLAIALQQMGKLTLVLDADMGMANVHLLAGVNPTQDIMAVVKGEAELSDIILEGPSGIGIIPGGGGFIALADSSRQERRIIIDALSEVELAAETILVDTGAGMAGSVRDFLVSADDILFVLTPDITSLADAYGLLKGLSQEDEGNTGAIFSVVNMVRSTTEAADVAQRFAECADRFLGKKVKNLGFIMKDSTVGASAFQRTPYSLFRPQARVSINTRNVAKALLKLERPGIKLSSSFSKYLKRVDYPANE